MIIPQPEQLQLPIKIAGQFFGRYTQLYQNFSPTLPLHFDKSYLPKNICQRQFLDLMECTVFNYHDKPNSCSYYISRFEQCRKNRDLRILQGIKQWEGKHIKSLDNENRQMYLQGLTFKVNRLKQQYERLPSTQAQQLKLHRIEKQIQQIKWRMKNIRNIIKQEQKIKNQNQTNKNINNINKI